MSLRNTSIAIVIFNFIIAAFFLACWIVNLSQFINCDFEAPYKKEIIKGIGITGVSFITVFVANDQK